MIERIAPLKMMYDCGDEPLFETHPIYCVNCRIVRHRQIAINESLAYNEDQRKEAMREYRKQYPCLKTVEYNPIKY